MDIVRALVLLYNCLVKLEDMCGDDEDVHEYLLDEIGMTEEEYDEVMNK